MAPLEPWGNANPDDQVSTRGRGGNSGTLQKIQVLTRLQDQGSYRKWDDSKQAFIDPKRRSDKENSSDPISPTIDTPKLAKKPTGLGKGKCLPVLDRRPVDGCTIAKGGSSSPQPRGERGRFTLSMSPCHQKTDKLTDQGKCSSVLPSSTCQQLKGDEQGQGGVSSIVGEKGRFSNADEVYSRLNVIENNSSGTKDIKDVEMLGGDEDSLESDGTKNAAAGATSDKARITSLTTSCNRYMNANRTLTIIAEIALKGSLLWSPNDCDVFPLSQTLHDRTGETFSTSTTESDPLARMHGLFDHHGHLSPTLTCSPTSRAIALQEVVMGVLVRIHNELSISFEGYDLPTFLALAASFIPQIQFVSETGVGDTFEEQKCGINAAWSVLIDILKLSVQPLPESQFGFSTTIMAIWTPQSFKALAALDKLVLKTISKKQEIVSEQYDHFGVHAKYWPSNLAYLRNAEKTLEQVARKMAQAGGGVGDESWFLPKTREGIARVLDYADTLRKQSEKAMVGGGNWGTHR